METTTDLNIIQAIGFIYDESKECKLSKDFFEKTDPDLEILAMYFGINSRQAFLLSIIFVFNYKGDSTDVNELARHFDVNPVKMIEFHSDLLFLTEKGFLKKRRSKQRILGNTRFRFANGLANDKFAIEESILMAVIKNSPILEIKQTVFTDVISVLEKIYLLGKERDDENISIEELFEEMKNTLDLSAQFELIRKVRQFQLCDHDNYLFLYLVWKRISGDESSDLSTAADGLFDNPSNKIFYTQSILAKKNDLITKGLIEVELAKFHNNSEIKLTEKSLNMLLSENIQLYFKKNRENVLTLDSIKKKHLFFSDTESRQLNMLRETLSECNLKKLQVRLVEKAMPTGIAILFYGTPGTGKTESVLQIAKQTGREIMKVDISESKSCWFGESEKMIKRIFTDYNELIKQSTLCPILLFNEADAIFSKRNDISNSGTKQTENAIQNIILEEMENFKGILFATTNLTTNFDNAFERRFLYKVEFLQPDKVQRAKIWKSKITSIPKKECLVLAEKFNFSGGQIENIARKSTMWEIINGNLPDKNEIISFCNEELISKSSLNKVGFK